MIPVSTMRRISTTVNERRGRPSAARVAITFMSTSNQNHEENIMQRSNCLQDAPGRVARGHRFAYGVSSSHAAHYGMFE
jgi:hypothetical protein